jgi:MraZ protein
MFLGQYEHSIDEKGRLTIPHRFRTLLENGIYLMPGLDGNLMLMPYEYFQRISNKIAKMNMADPIAREYMRQFFANTEQVTHDDVWRILVSQNLRQLGQLNSNAIIVGSGQYAEIWSPDLWADQLKKLTDPTASAKKFASLNLADE